MDIQTTFDALSDLVADVISAGFMAAIAQHDTTREIAQNLRDGALVQALLGAQLTKLLGSIAGDAERKTAIRYASYLKHPRLGRGPLIDEAEDADASLNEAVIAAQSSTGVGPKVTLALAILRVRAITQAIGPACIYPPHERTAPGRKGQRQRRREITAADVPDEVAEILLRPVGSVDDQAALVRSLAEIESGEHNRGALVTKIIALVDQPDGHVVLNTIAGRIRRARFERSELADSSLPVPSSSQVLRTVSTPLSPPVGRGDEIGGTVAAMAAAQSQPSSDTPAPGTALRARFEQRGPKILSGKERLAQSQAKRRERFR